VATASEHTHCLFQEPWWLDALAPGSWSAVELDTGGSVYARLPYVHSRKYGLRVVGQPKLTQTLGPWLAIPEAEKPTRRLAREMEWLNTLIDQLPPFDYFKQSWHHSMHNWLPFHWRGFECSNRMTYVLDDLTDVDRVWSSYHSKTQWQIKKSRRILTVRDDLGLDVFWPLLTMTFERQGRKVPYPRELVERLDAACVKQEARRIFFAEDSSGKVHAAVYLVWDERAAYYLMSGSDPELRSSGAISLLLHEAIAFAATKARCFDFEGSMIEPVERFFRNFGATQRSLLVLRGYSRRMKVAQGLRQIASALRS
jgi:hypothetical protein